MLTLYEIPLYEFLYLLPEQTTGYTKEATAQ